MSSRADLLVNVVVEAPKCLPIIGEIQIHLRSILLLKEVRMRSDSHTFEAPIKYTLARAQSSQHKLYEVMRAKDAATLLFEANKAASAPKPAGGIISRGSAPEHTAQESEVILEVELMPTLSEMKDGKADGCGLCNKDLASVIFL